MSQETLLSRLEKRQQDNARLYATGKFPMQLSPLMSLFGLQFSKTVLPLSLVMAVVVWWNFREEIMTLAARLLWL